MTMNPRRGSARAMHEARVTWLRDHAIAAVNVPGLNDDVSDTGRAALEDLRYRMRGLFGKTMSAERQRETIRRLVSERRGENVGGGAW
jgi:hypothetical protein